MIKIYSSGSTEESITGAVGVTETGATTMKQTLPPNKLRNGDRVHVRCHFECTGKGTAPSYTPSIRVGGISGQRVQAAGVVHAANQSEWVDFWMTWKTVGGSPVWSYHGTINSESNANYDGPFAASGLTSPASNAAIDILPTVQFAATPNGTDAITVRDLTVEIHRP